MKKICCSAICLTYISCITPTSAAVETHDTYLKAELGSSMLQKFNQENYDSKKAKTSVIINVGIGSFFNENFSTDINLYSAPNGKFNKVIDAEQVTQKFKTHATFISMNYEWGALLFKPFITAGVGIAINDADDYNILTSSGEYLSTVGKSNTNLAFNVGLGAKLPLNDNFEVSLAYRYFDFGHMKSAPIQVINTTDSLLATAGIISPIKTKLRTHSIMLGLIYRIQ